MPQDTNSAPVIETSYNDPSFVRKTKKAHMLSFCLNIYKHKQAANKEIFASIQFPTAKTSIKSNTNTTL